MPDLLSDALTRLLTGRRRVPGTLAEAYGEFGDNRTEQNQALARLLVEQEGGKYRSKLRSVQRYRTSAKQTRTPRTARLTRILADARRRAGVTISKADSVRANGADMQITATFQVSRSTLTQTMPKFNPEHITGPAMGPSISAWEVGDLDKASAELLGAFLDAYWPHQGANPIEVERYQSVYLEVSA